jgi:hypothetical protein
MNNATNPQFPVLTMHQKDQEVFVFVWSADDLMKYAKVDRFGDSSDGVNRKLDEGHALKIADAMTNNSRLLMLDAICGDLQGNWIVQNGLLIRGDEEAMLSVDDGQHRWWATTDLLNPEERSRWAFAIVATKKLNYDTRLSVFRQQSKRKKIDSKLDLAQRWKLDEWASPEEREAYRRFPPQGHDRAR